MTLSQIDARIRKLQRVNLKVAEYLRVCDLTHRAIDGGPCQDPRCKAIARKHQENEEEIVRLIDQKYVLMGQQPKHNVFSTLLNT